jgi:uncharacterized membrane protein YjgN (DUF898 family)
MNMEQVYTDTHKINFHGDGAKLFRIYILNFLLTVLTLGLYYPWAKAALLQYLYQETEFKDSRFAFHGTGREMFIGFVKALGILFVIYCLLAAAALSGNTAVLIAGFLVFYILLFLLIPIAIHGSLRYRMSRSSWRGIHFGYRGDRNELIRLFFIGSLLTVCTFGIYFFWLIIKMRKYIFQHLRFGDLRFSYEAEGSKYLVLHLKGYFLTVITLGIYVFWYARDLFNYYIDNIRLYQDHRVVKFRSTATAGACFTLIIVNFLIIILTLGLGTPWAIVRSFEFITGNVIIEGPLDADAIRQTEGNYTDATGEDLADIIDIGLV